MSNRTGSLYGTEIWISQEINMMLSIALAVVMWVRVRLEVSPHVIFGTVIES